MMTTMMMMMMMMIISLAMQKVSYYETPDSNSISTHYSAAVTAQTVWWLGNGLEHPEM
jgi:hypothetical protein